MGFRLVGENMKEKIMSDFEKFANIGKISINQEPDASNAYWQNSAKNTLPPPDFGSLYNRNKTLPPKGIKNRKAYIIGSGIAGLASAFYLIRDAQMPGENITIIDAMGISGGSLDGSGNAEDGYIVRGGREMTWTYDNFWDMYQDVPALELPKGYSVLDEYRIINDNDSTYSKSRIMHEQGKVKDFSKFGLDAAQQWELVQLLLKRKEDLDNITVEEYFSKGFLKTNFWTLWRTMFAFQNWHSLLEMKLYMHRFLDAFDGLTDMSALVFAKYNQYDSFVRPLIKMLQDKGVKIQFGSNVYDFEMEITDVSKIVTAIKYKKGGQDEILDVANDDVVIALTGSMTEATSFGDMDSVPILRASDEPAADSAWSLWRNLAKKSPVFGKPEKFYGNVKGSIWESATLTCKTSALTEKIKELSVNDPYSGRTVTGGIITFDDSKWLLSITCNRQPHFPDQPKDVLVLWAYALFMDKDGDYIKKPMPECNGREILIEICYHLGIIDQIDDVLANTKIRLSLMPYITAQFMPRAAGDRPRIVPEGCKNLALVGQFVETNNDVVFTVESSVRGGRVAVYSLLNIPKQVPDINHSQYDIRNLLRAARTLNNNQPFIGERLLHLILGKTYFAHILPPLPEEKTSFKDEVEKDLRIILEKGSSLFKTISFEIGKVISLLKKE